MPATTTSPSGQNAGPPLPPRVHRPPEPKKSHGHRTSQTERLVIVGVAVAAAVVGAFSDCEPTTFAFTNVLLRAGTAAMVTLAASRARRWTWLVLAGLAAVGAPSGPWLWVAAAGLVFAFVTVILPRRRLYGAIVGALSVQGLLRLTDVGFERSSALLFVVAVLPVLGSAFAVSPRRVRRRVYWTVGVVAGLMLFATILFGIAALLAYSTTQRGVREAKSGLASVRDGQGAAAASTLDEAADSFTSANRTLDSWWARPAGAVPLVAQQARAIQVVTKEGAAMSRVAASTAKGADVQQLKYENGRIDVERLRSLADPLTNAATTFQVASDHIAAVQSPWLFGPLADRVEEVDKELRKALPEVQLAAEGAREGPGLLGADGTRRYFVLFTQPAESRALGGFAGNWAVITASDGRLDLTTSGRAKDLNPPVDQDPREVTNPPVPGDYVSRYQRFHPGQHFQDVTLSPDLPSVAAAVAQLYPEAGGDKVDGVLTVDPYALAALLQFTGPITINGFDQPLTADNAADILVRDQYLQFGSNEERGDFLDQASRKTFDALVHGSLPSPRKVGDVLGPMVDQHRLQFHPFDAGEQHLIDEVRAGGEFPAPTGDDFFEAVTQNNANNKIDLFLHRQVEYQAVYNPVNGDIESNATVTLRNDAPAAGLPASVIGSNDQGLPPGTNRVYFSFYTPLGLREAKVAGQQVPLEFQRELGYAVYSKYIEIPPGASVTVELTLFGHLSSTSHYHLTIGTQPLVNADSVAVRLAPTGDFELVRSDPLNIDANGGVGTATLQPQHTIRVDAEFGRP